MKYESFAKKLEILMFEYQKTGNVSLTQNPGGCREHNNLLRRSDTTDIDEEMVVVRKPASSSYAQRTSNCYASIVAPIILGYCQ